MRRLFVSPKMLTLFKRAKVVDSRDRSSNVFCVEPMEPRVLLSADALGIDAGVLDRDEIVQSNWDQTTLPDWSAFVTADLDDSPGQNDRGTVPEPLDPAVLAHLSANTKDSCDCLDALALVPLSAHTETLDPRQEIVFLDAGVTDGEMLLADLVGGDTDITQVFILDPNEDGIEQITRALAGTQDIDAIHIVSHGSPGSLQLGNSVVNTVSLSDYSVALSAWGQSLATDADILIYGCDLAANPQGQTLVNAISALTGADVAASTDLTGDLQQGGDWDLEYSVGSVEADTAFSMEAQRNYSRTLADITSGLVVHLEFEDGSGTVAADSTPNNNDALLDPLAEQDWTTGAIGGAFHFDFSAGDEDFFEIPDSATVRNVQEGSFTLAAWFNPDDLPTLPDDLAYGVIAKEGNHTGLWYTWDQKFHFEHTLSGPSWPNFGTTNSFAPGSFYHVAVTVDRPTGTMALYVNGQLEGTHGFTPGAAAYEYGGETWKIGTVRDTFGGSIDFPAKGIIDDVRIYDRALSGADVSELYSLGNSVPTATNLTSTSSYPEGAASVALDDIVVTDGDTGETITATLTLNNTGAGSLTTGTFGAATSTYTAGTGVWTVSGSVPDVNAALADVAFLPATDNDTDTTITTHIEDAAGAGPADGTITLDVTPVNDAPSINTFAGYGVNEDDNYRALSGISIDDIDAGGADVQVSLGANDGVLLIGNPTGLTSISGNDTGSVVLVGSITDLNTALASLSYKPNPDYTGSDNLSITVDDLGNTGSGGSQVTIKDVPLTVNAINDEQVLSINTGTTVAEGSTGTVISVAMLETTDVDHSAAQLVYTVTSVPGNGTLRLSGVVLGLSDTFTQDDIDNNLITYDHDGSETTGDSFGFSVDDGAGIASTGTFAITVTPQNDAPVIVNNGGLSVPEEATRTITAAELQATDVDNTPNEIVYTMTALPSGGTVRLNGSVLGISDTFTQDDIDNNRVTYRDTDNGETTSFQFTISDGTYTSGNLTFAINGQPINDAPVVVAPGSALTATEQVGLAVEGRGFSVTDVDEVGGGAVATISVGEGGITVVSGDSGVLITGGNGTGSVNLSGTIAQINNLLTGAGTGTITYLNNSDSPGASTVLNVTVNDQGNTGSDPGLSGDGSSEEGSNNVTINITPLNDEQVLAANTGTTVAEGSTGSIITNTLLAATDVDNTAAQLVYTVTVIPSNGTLYLNGAALGASDTFTQDDIDNNLITYDHDGSETTGDSFGFSVDDGAGTVSTGTFTITVTPLNDNDPVADDESFMVVEGGTVTEADLDIGSSLLDGDTDADLPNDTLTVNTTPVSGPSHGSLTLNANGTFSYTHDGSENFSDSFTYELLDADGGVTDTGTVTITITPQNDAPTLVNSIPDQVATENLPFNFQAAAGTFSETDTGDSLSYSALQTDGTPLPAWLDFDALTRTFSGTPANGDVSTRIEVTAQDSSGASVSTTFDLIVDAVNDAPILGNNNLTLNPGDTVVLTSGMLSAGDVDNAHAGLIFSVSDVSGGQFEFVSAPGIAVTSFNQAQVTAGNVVFVDDGDAEAPSYSVTVSDGADSLGPVAATVNFTPPTPMVTTAPLMPSVPDASAVTVPPATPTNSDVSVSESGPAVVEEALDTSETGEPVPEVDAATEDESVAPADDSGDVGAYAVEPPVTDSDTNVQDSTVQGLFKSFVVRPPVLAAMGAPSLIPAAFQLDALALEIRSVLASGDFNDSLDRVRDDVSNATLIYQSLVGSGVAVTTGLSVGYVAWLVRGGVLLSTALSSLPAWQFVDPLPVLSRTQDKKSPDDPESVADDSLEAIIEERSSRVANQSENLGDKSDPGTVSKPVEKRP